MDFFLKTVNRTQFDIYFENKKNTYKIDRVIKKEQSKNIIFRFYDEMGTNDTKVIRNKFRFNQNNLFFNLPGIYIIEYITNNYFFIANNDKEEIYTAQVKLDFKINLILTEITSKYKNSHSLVFLSKTEKDIKIFKYLLTNVKDNEEFILFSKIIFYEKNQANSNLKHLLNIIKESEIISAQNYTKALKTEKMLKLGDFQTLYSNSFIEFENSYFALICNNNIFLFEKFENQSILIQNFDIAFMDNPFPLNLNFTNYQIENFHYYCKDNGFSSSYPNLNKDAFISIDKDYFYFLSSRKFIYKISLKSKNSENDYLPIFKDITLNFNNSKYVELLKSVKILILYNLEIRKIPFYDLKKFMKNIFHEYDIYSYIENIQDILSYENIIFFINYNFNSSKIYVIILFCMIFEKYNFIRSLFNLLLNMEYYMNFNSDKKDIKYLIDEKEIIQPQKEGIFDSDFLVEHFDLNKEFVIYILCILDFLKEFSLEFENVNFSLIINEFFKKVLDDTMQNNLKLLYYFISDYLIN